MKHRKNPAFSKAFGNQVKKLRLEKSIGKREFAILADIEYSMLQNIEAGTSNPTLATVMLLAEGLKISHQELFDFKFSPKKNEK